MMAVENRFRKELYYLLIIIPFYISSLSGQILIHKNLNVESGLIYSQVLCAYQDRQGYMWFGTSSGVSRWDGHHFENFHSTDKIRFDNVKLITELPDGTLTFVTRHNLLTYETGIFKKEENLPDTLNTWIEQAVKLSDGNIYLAGQKSGVWCYDGEVFLQILPDDQLNDFSVTSFYRLDDGGLLLGTDRRKVVSLKNNKLINLKVLPERVKNAITWIHKDRDGLIYIGTKGYGLFTLDNEKLYSFEKLNGLPSNNINHMFENSRGDLYIATDEGVAILSEKKVIGQITSQNGLSNSFTWFIGEDNQNNIYICTDGGGVNIYRPGAYQTYNKTWGLPDETVWSIEETSDHLFYFATDYGVALLNQDQSSEMRLVNELSEYMVITIYEASDGTVYFGTNESGVCVFRNNQFSIFNISNGLTSNSVWSIVEDDQERIYLGTYDGGICVLKNGQIVDTLNTEDGLPNDFIVSAYTTGNGRVYFGLDNGGVCQVINGKYDPNSHLMPEMTIWSFLQSTSGILYMGTDKNGLICFTPAGTDTITLADGLSNNAILGIMEDNTGRIYLTTDNGMNILNFSQNPTHIRIITRDDGLASSECNQGAYLKDSQGNLWIGTIRGVTKYNPAADLPTMDPPLTHITQIRIFDREVSLDEQNNLPPLRYNENYLQFHFIGIDFVAPHKVRYRYRLNKQETNWINTDYPQIQFANLEDNNYRFEVQSGNEWGIWSEPVTINFSILPPFWETWWFRLIVVVVLGGILGGFVYTRIRSIVMIERVRAKIAADLHDDIGAGLSEINILSAVAEAKTPPEAKEKVQSELNRISKTAGQIIDSMSDIVWMVNPKKDSMTDLVSRLKDIFNDVLDAKGIVFRSENIDLLKNIRLDMERRQFLFLIFKEGMNNAIKYSNCHEISLKVLLERKKLKITLQDDGKGFEMDKLRIGNGLNNMQDRAKKIKGEVQIKSTPGKGTLIEFIGKI
jgi:ligand-binding sensor domain-containing protein/two-component sensor histidine kinase